VLNTLSALLGSEPECRFEQDSTLLAGLRIGIGPWVLRANLHDELQSFAEAAHD
jgi:F-type H+-transporting ATPase subunit b